ncbi:60S acidic ribosomal protein P1 [Marasmius crinis-equi]|uniref:60S acidic ribosomal protein P1 n=1 Tax=Marasmius crinis-equi TaxID=585013 RepID=A0ABR3FRR4_9AGAR
MAISTPAPVSRRRNSTSNGSDTFKSTSYETPARPSSRAGGVLSPPLSTTTSTGYASSTVTGGGSNTRMNIVTRVAIEGKAKPGEDGAAVRMYLKENVKILDSVVHPLDSSGAPYNFDSKITPLLHSAGRALNLPARSQQTFQSAFGLSPPPSDSSSIHTASSSSRTSKGKTVNGSSSVTDSLGPVDPLYTGHILVSGYHISYVSPKVFPPQYPDDVGSGISSVRSSGKYGSRRISIGDRDRVQAQFVAAIELLVPYVSQPPRSPYLAIPTPRCLHNNIKLRIFPPVTSNTSASLASLSSLDDESAGSWDLASDPHVTRAPTSSARSRASSNGYGTNSYHGNEADDESSDSSTAGFSYGCGIQGSFPSTERIRLRWAKPVKNLDIPRYGSMESSTSTIESGRRRVGVKSVKGEMTCIVKGKATTVDGTEGVVMEMEYKGTCKDVWYPGVATLLGMDVSLEAKNSDVSWFRGEGSPGAGWDINGGTGYTGFDVGNETNPRQAAGRFDSMESNSSNPQIHITPTSPLGASSTYPSRQNSNASSSSLLRAPLPGGISVAEYSFEGAVPTTDPSTSVTSTQMSSIGSLPTSSNLTESVASKAPGYPITLHLNMNELLPPAKNEFTFTIRGTVLVVPRTRYNPRVNGSSKRQGSGAESDETTSASGPDDRDLLPVTLPRFTVLAADKESTTIVVRNEVAGNGASVEVYNPSGDIHTDAQARKTVLQRGAFTKCSEGGGRIVVKMPQHGSGYANGHAGGYLHAPGTRTPNDSGRSSPVLGHGLSRVASHGNLTKYGTTVTQKMRPKRDGELMIPWVYASVTTLFSTETEASYAVRVRLPAPAEMNGNDWLEFGLAKSGPSASSSTGSDKPPNLMIVGVSVDGVPVRYEATATAVKDESLGGVGFEEMSSREWISWVRVRVGGVGGGEVTIDYVVKDEESERKKGKRREGTGVSVDVYLPSFPLPVGRFEVLVEGQTDLDSTSIQTNFLYSAPSPSGSRLMYYTTEPFFYPQLSFLALPRTKPISRTLSRYFKLCLIIALISFLSTFMYRVQLDLAKLNRSVNTLRRGYARNLVPGLELDPVTVTTTVYASSSQPQWDWFGGGESGGTAPSSEPVMASFSSIETTTSVTSPPFASESSNSPPKDDRLHQTPPEEDGYNGFGQEVLSEPAPSFVETFGLVPYRKLMNFTWGDLKPVAQSLSQAIGVLWQIARKVYHYPLDPP